MNLFSFADHITGDGHPEQPKRATHTYEVLQDFGLTKKCVSLPAKKCEEDQLTLVHDLKYLKVAKLDSLNRERLSPLVTRKFVKIHGIFPPSNRRSLTCG